MANVKAMNELFDYIDRLIADIAGQDNEKRETLENFVFRLLSTFDGMEGPSRSWKGISLVARSDSNPQSDEINDEFLHDAYSNRK